LAGEKASAQQFLSILEQNWGTRPMVGLVAQSAVGDDYLEKTIA
jgi:hypothetical protein